MESWTVILTVPMAFLSAFGQINIFNQMAGSSGTASILYYQNGELLPTLTTIISMMAGTMFGIWLGQLISEYGIPNQGLSLIIFAGIVARIPQNMIYIMADVSAWLVDAVIDHRHPGVDHFCHCLRPTGAPQCAGHFPGAGSATACPCLSPAICR